MNQPSDGIEFRDVPGFAGIRADARGWLWRKFGEGWERIGTGKRYTIVLVVDGRKTFVNRHRLVCSAWHVHPDGPDRAVQFLDGDRNNLRPSNLQ